MMLKDYLRKKINIAYAEANYEAFLYIAEEDYFCHGVLPFTWYMDFVCSGANEHQIPKEYIEMLRHWKCQIDTNKKRDNINRQILGLSR